jgi:hypothetical protein
MFIQANESSWYTSTAYLMDETMIEEVLNLLKIVDLLPAAQLNADDGDLDCVREPPPE